MNVTDADLADLTAQQLMDERMAVLAQLGELDLEFDRRAQRRRRLVERGEAQWQEDPRTGVRMWPIISPELGFDIHAFCVVMLEVPPHFSAGKYHVHGDAVKYYLEGSGREHIGDETFDVSAGDFIHVPAGVWHGTENPHDEPVRVLAVQQWPGAPTQIAEPCIARRT